MPSLDLQLDGDNCWPDLNGLEHLIADGRVLDYTGNKTTLGMAVLPGGTTGGNPSVTIRINAPDGKIVLTEITWRLLYAAVRAIETRYGPPP